MQVTGGKILYNRSVQPAPYESKALGAEWSFSAEPGEDAAAISRKMTKDMMLLVHEALGLVKNTAQTAATPAAGAPATVVASLPATVAPKTRAKKAAEPKPAETKPEPAADSAEVLGGDVAGPQPKDDGEFVIEPEIAQISDADLKSACAKAAQKLGDGGAVKVKEWAAKFRIDATKAFQVADIAQTRRQEFLDGLEKLA